MAGINDHDRAEQLRAIREGSTDNSNAVLNLRGADLAGEDLNGADLSRADLSGADLSGARLFKSNLVGANLEGANLEGAELTGADLTSANLEGVRAKGAGLGMAKLKDARLFEANLRNSTLSKAQIDGADLRCASLQHARIREADLTNADLTGANLQHADMSLCSVDGANFNNADLRNARLRQVSGFQMASWFGVDIRDINFAGAYRMRRFIVDENYLKEFRDGGRITNFVYHLWWITSDCGRSMVRWCAWVGVVAAVFAFAFAMVNVDYGDHPTWLSPLYYSVVTLTTLGYGDVVPASTAAQVVAVIEVIIGYLMLGGLLSILGNKMARRGE